MKAHIFFHLVHFRYYWVQSSNKVIGSNMSMFWGITILLCFLRRRSKFFNTGHLT